MAHVQKVPVKDAVERIITAYSMLGTISDIDNLRKVLYEEVTQESSNTMSSNQKKSVIVIGGLTLKPMYMSPKFIGIDIMTIYQISRVGA